MVTAVFLEDPPMYLGEQAEWDKGVYATTFPILRDKEIELQSIGAGLRTYVKFAANTPALQGGVAADHIRARQLESVGSALQRHDPSTWAPVLDLTAFQTLNTSLPLRVPTRVLQADNVLGSAFMAGHEERFIATNPAAEVVLYEGATHRIHATRATETRFLDDVEAFISRYAVR